MVTQLGVLVPIFLPLLLAMKYLKLDNAKSEVSASPPLVFPISKNSPPKPKILKLALISLSLTTHIQSKIDAESINFISTTPIPDQPTIPSYI